MPEPLGALPPVGIILNVVTNLAFLFPLVRALRQRDYVRAYLAAHIVVFSSNWHLCAPANGACVLSRPTSRTGDYVSSLLLPISVLLKLVPFGRVLPTPEAAARGAQPRPARYYVELWLHLVAVTVILIAGAENGGFWPLPWVPYLTLLGGALAIVALAWLTLWRRYGHPPWYDGIDLAIGIVAGAAGLVLFLGIEDALLPYYWSWLVHAPWHVLAAIAFFYVLEARSDMHRGLAQFGAWAAAPDPGVVVVAPNPYNLPVYQL